MAYKYVEQVQYKKLSTKANKGNYRALAFLIILERDLVNGGLGS